MNEWSLGWWWLYVVSVSAITGFVVTIGGQLVFHFIWWVRRQKRMRLIQRRQNLRKSGTEEFRKKRRVWDGYMPEDTDSTDYL